MKTYPNSKYHKIICPYCEKPVVTDEISEQYSALYKANDYEDNAPAMLEFEAEIGDHYCWLSDPEQCLEIGYDLTDRLIEVLEERDELKRQLEKLHLDYNLE